MRIARFAVAAGFVFVLVVIAFIDLDHKLILNKVTYPGIAVFYAAGVVLWLMATRAAAVSSRLTALSGNWRAGM